MVNRRCIICGVEVYDVKFDYNIADRTPEGNCEEPVAESIGLDENEGSPGRRFLIVKSYHDMIPFRDLVFRGKMLSIEPVNKDIDYDLSARLYSKSKDFERTLSWLDVINAHNALFSFFPRPL